MRLFEDPLMCQRFDYLAGVSFMESPYDRHEQPGGFPTVRHFYTLEDLQLFTSFGYVKSNFIRGWYPLSMLKK